ncbi:MAG TPA: hypothetical protein VGJ21_10110 [Terracidiphilus sp.]|jgi:hypothetical protein
MPEVPPKLAYQQVSDKLDWAKQHIQKLHTVHREWWEVNPTVITGETNSDTGDVTYYVDKVPSIPSTIPLITGDILHSLRGALDYLACGIVPVVTHDTKFPIAHSAQAYEASLSRLVPGLQGEALETLNSIRPYQGGNLCIWELHRLNIIDKHRLLLTVGAINMGPRFFKEGPPTQEKSGPKQVVFKANDGTEVIIKFVKQGPVSLYQGQELLTLSASQTQKEVSFCVAVGINEPGLAEGIPLLMLLELISAHVGIAIRKLAPFIVR